MKKIIAIAVMLLSIAASAQHKNAYRPEIAVLGDSYSTFEGYIPDGYACWYFNANDPKLTDVNNVKQTWWWQVCSKGGYKLGVNDSWSGSTICNTGYDDADYSDRSFISRVAKLGNPDIILVFGGTNDAWGAVPVGEYKYDDFKRADLYTFRPGFARMLEQLIERHPGTDIRVLINTQIGDDVPESMRTICKHYGVKTIELHDISKKAGHPDIEGMKAIADQVIEALKK